MSWFGHSDYDMSVAKNKARNEGWSAGYAAGKGISASSLATGVYSSYLMGAYELGRSSVNSSHGPTYKYQGQTFDCHSKKYSKDLNELFGKYTDDVVDLWNEYDGDLTLKQLQRKMSEFTKELLKEKNSD